MTKLAEEITELRRKVLTVESRYHSHEQQYYSIDCQETKAWREEVRKYNDANDTWRWVYFIWLIALTGLVIRLYL